MTWPKTFKKSGTSDQIKKQKARFTGICSKLTAISALVFTYFISSFHALYSENSSFNEVRGASSMSDVAKIYGFVILIDALSYKRS